MDVTQRKSALESMYQIVLRRHCSLITHNQVGVTSTVLNMKKSSAGHQRTEIKIWDGCRTSEFSTIRVNIQIFSEKMESAHLIGSMLT